jgi:hypothetical protein
VGDEGLIANVATDSSIRTSGDGPQPGEAESEAPSANSGDDVDLARLIAAWPMLPRNVRDSIRAKVQPASTGN